MLIFIDDSGDPGFKVAKGSTEYFIICLVIFDDPLEAEETALKIKKLRRELNLSDNFEFKFNKCRKEFRCQFLDVIRSSKFRVRAIVMDKSKIYGEELRRSRESFYGYAIKMVLKHHSGTIRNAKLRLDGHGNRKFKQAFNTYLRKELNSQANGTEKVFLDLKFVDSKRNVLIQLADMVAGTINRKYNRSKTDRIEYYNIIKDRIENIWDFGK